ncbi:uncharacterized protein LOC142231287 [Haematobia irritans]|uniref:uncharacterized protein LOC142231287 n=1 Tax=Haematobia irritans TaxID=7368 RepID=UPI003F4F92BB
MSLNSALKVCVKNKQNISIPEYLNVDFFTKTLEEGLREIQIVIRELDFQWGTKPGDNYCSNVYRVLVTYDNNGQVPEKNAKLHLIVKSVLTAPESIFLHHVGVFVKEKVMYADVLPRLDILIREDHFGAKCFYTTKSPMQTMVFNDLKFEGFKMHSRFTGLDWNHSLMVLQKLAKFHAASMVLIKNDPAITKRFIKGLFCEEAFGKSETLYEMFGGYLNQLVKITSSWTNYEYINSKLQKYYNRFKEISATLGNHKEGDRVKVINHGDLWATNFMFAYEDVLQPTVPTKIRFINNSEIIQSA